MEVQCLSIPNPLSYLVCAGIKDVENRGFGTDYRGTLYIHSSGRYGIRGMPPLEEYPVPVIHEFNRIMDAIGEMHDASRYIAIPDHGVTVMLKQEDRQSNRTINEYNLLSDVYHYYQDRPRNPFFKVNAIIGSVTLADVVKNSRSEWAEKGYHHWILQDARLFKEPIKRVRNTRAGLWTYEVPDGEAPTV